MTALVHVVIFHNDDLCRVISNTDRLIASAFAAGFEEGTKMFSRELFHGAVTIVVLPGDEDELAFNVRMKRINPVQVERMRELIADAEAKIAPPISPVDQ